MIRTAGRVADGVLGHGLFTDRWWAETVEPALGRGAEAGGRVAADLRRWGWLITAVDDDDPARAVRDAKLQIAFYPNVRTYDSLVEMDGWQDEVAAIRRAFRGSPPGDIADHVTDDMLWAIAICGNSEQARDMLSARTRLPELAFAAAPSFLFGQRRRARYGEAAIALMSRQR